jgi:hypothetical protein
MDLAHGGAGYPEPGPNAQNTQTGEQSEEEIISQTMQGLVTHMTTQVQLMLSRIQAHHATDVMADIMQAPELNATPAARSALWSHNELQDRLRSPQSRRVETATQRYVTTIINTRLDAAGTGLALATDTVDGGLKVLRTDPDARPETSCPDSKRVTSLESELRYDHSLWSSQAAMPW